MAKTVITGGAGFIGTHIAERLLKTGDGEIVLVDNFRRDSLKYATSLKDNPRVKTISADVEDPKAIAAAFAGCETVIHLAAIAGVSSYYQEPLQTLRTNILGTVNVLEQATAAGAKRLIYFSTSEVYGRDADGVDENTPLSIGPPSESRWVYAVSKLSGENFVMRHCEKHGLPCVIIRPFNIYGPRQVGEGAISNFCRSAASGKPLIIHGDGSAIRAWCYIDDLVDAVEHVLKHRPDESVFNIGNPQAVETTLGLARKVAALVPGAKLEHAEAARSEIPRRIPSIERARKSLHFEPRVSLDEGLQLTLRWFQDHVDG
jgi:nucleoside-diphosphate-sugar epimerase